MKKAQFSSIWPIDRTLIRYTTPRQSGPGSDGNQGVLRIPQSSSIAGTSSSDCLVVYREHSLGGSYPSAEKQSVYSTAPANCARDDKGVHTFQIQSIILFWVQKRHLCFLNWVGGNSIIIKPVMWVGWQMLTCCFPALIRDCYPKRLDCTNSQSDYSTNKIGKIFYRYDTELTDKMKRSFFQAAVVSILLYRCTTWTLTKRLEKKLDGNYTRMLRAILNKFWRQHPTRHQQYGCYIIAEVFFYIIIFRWLYLIFRFS